MNKFLKHLVFIGLFLGLTSFSPAAEKTWTGKISDSMCGASHAKMTAGGKMTDTECTAACVKAGGKYVFVSEGKVYTVANQDFADLPIHAGHTVMLTGEMSGDTITVTKIAMGTAAKK